jgi:hypothetical protein
MSYQPYRIKLDYGDYNGRFLPQCWVNFVHYHRFQHSEFYGVLLRERISRALLEYHAVYWEHEGGKEFIDFYDELAYTWFVLKWS